jgi:hypothetical protein
VQRTFRADGRALSGLDLIAVDKVCKMIAEVANAHEFNTVIVVTHDIAAAVAVSDTIWLLGRDRDADGRNIPGARVKATYNLAGRGSPDAGNNRDRGVHRRGARDPRSLSIVVAWPIRGQMPDEKRKRHPGLRDAFVRESQELGVDNTNFVKEALKWQYNWIGLAGAAAFAVISGSGFPLVLAAGLELIYVALVPQSSAFRRLVRSWQYAEEKRKIEMRLHAMYQEIPPETRVRYGRLDQLCRNIR